MTTININKIKQAITPELIREQSDTEFKYINDADLLSYVDEILNLWVGHKANDKYSIIRQKPLTNYMKFDIEENLDSVSFHIGMLEKETNFGDAKQTVIDYVVSDIKDAIDFALTEVIETLYGYIDYEQTIVKNVDENQNQLTQINIEHVEEQISIRNVQNSLHPMFNDLKQEDISAVIHAVLKGWQYAGIESLNNLDDLRVHVDLPKKVKQIMLERLCYYKISDELLEGVINLRMLQQRVERELVDNIIMGAVSGIQTAVIQKYGVDPIKHREKFAEFLD